MQRKIKRIAEYSSHPNVFVCSNSAVEYLFVWMASVYVMKPTGVFEEMKSLLLNFKSPVITLKLDFVTYRLYHLTCYC